MCLGIFGAILRHTCQDRLGMESQNGKFYIQRRIKHHIGIFLIWIYPLLLCFAHCRPLAYGFLCRECALVVVAYDAAKQSIVAGGYPVMSIERNACERGDIHLIFAFIGHLGGKHGIESMYALYQQHFALAELQALAVIFALAGGEIKFGYLHRLAAQQVEQIALHSFAVHCLDVVEIILAVGKLGRILTIDEIIVGRKR